MQGQRSTNNSSFSDSINFDHGSPSTNVADIDIDCNPSGRRDPTTGKIVLTVDNWRPRRRNYINRPPLVNPITGAESMSEDQLPLNLRPNGLITRTSFMVGSSSTSPSPNFDSQKSIGFESAGFLVEDDNVRNNADGRVSCKRKSLEGDVGQSSRSGGFCFSSREQGNVWRATPDISSNLNLPEPVNRPLDLDTGLTASRGPEGSRRSNRMRTSPQIPPVQPNSMLNNSFLPENPSTDHSLRLAPTNPSQDSVPPVPPEISAPQNRTILLRAPIMRRNHDCSSMRRSSLSNSFVPDDVVFVDPISRTIVEAPTFAPRVEAGSSSLHSTNLSLGRDNFTMNRNTGSSSGPGSGSGSDGSSHSLEEPGEGSNRLSWSQHSQRLAEYVRGSLLSTVGSNAVGQASSSSQASLVPNSQQEPGVIPSRGRNQVRNQSRSRPASRQGDSARGMPPMRASMAAGGGRRMLVSEIRNALDMLRRGEGLQIEDAMLLDQSIFFGMPDAHDQHRDMRLDVDNMSYEELLALEERIGNVCTGLSKEVIMKCMKQHKHVRPISDVQTGMEPCCVCQEAYKNGEDIGTLDCGHDFHKECITQWLSQKNLCPICKKPGLAT